jgi:uncharacterized protein (TIGR02466 family)
MQVLPAFPSSIYAQSIPLSADEQVTYVNLINQNLTGHSVMSQTPGHLHELAEFSDLLDKFKQVVAQCLNEDIGVIYEGFKINQMWGNRYENNQYIGKHTHPNNFLSGVFYLDADIDTGGTIFYNPNPCVKHVDLQFKNKPTMAWSTSLASPPMKHTLALFPSWLEHSSEPNPTDKTRYTISFNLTLTGAVGDKIDLTYAD